MAPWFYFSIAFLSNVFLTTLSFLIGVDNIKNLSRIPVSIYRNPLAIVAKMLEDNSVSRTEAKKYFKFKKHYS